MNTPMISKSISSAKSDFDGSDPEVRSQYATNVLESSVNLILTVSENPEKVVKAIVRSVESQSPPRNNFVGVQASVLRFVALLPGWLLGFLSSVTRAKSAGPTQEALARIQGTDERTKER